jgi:hypothetical protein
LVPTATLIAVLVNPKSSNAEAFVRNVQVRARTLGLKIEVVHAGTDGDLDPVFATLSRLLGGSLMIAPDLCSSAAVLDLAPACHQVLYALSGQIAALAIRHRVPTSFQFRRGVAAVV